MITKIKIGLVSLVAVTSIVLSAVTLAYDYPPSPYEPEFLNNNGCTWNYITSTGGSWGVSYYYSPVGACQYSNQQVVWSSYYPFDGIKYYYDVSGWPFD